jgi:hypothetical protein
MYARAAAISATPRKRQMIVEAVSVSTVTLHRLPFTVYGLPFTFTVHRLRVHHLRLPFTIDGFTAIRPR